MNRTAVAAILRKDAQEYRADRFFLLMTVASIIFYPLLFWLLPAAVNETIRIGVVQTGLDPVLEATSGAGIELTPYSSRADLEEVLVQGEDDLVAGLVFPSDFLATAGTAAAAPVTLLVTADVPPEIETTLQALVSDIAFGLRAEAPPVNPQIDAVVLGTDRVGDQVSLREQLRPMIGFFVLIVETFALATLVASEVQQRTVTAVLVTPATKADFLAAKGLLGTGVAFAEAAFVMLLIGAFATGAPILLLTLLLGAAIVTGFGMVAGALGRDFMTVLFTSMLFMIPLMIPAFSALFPGSAASWVQALPTYGFVQIVVEVTTQGAGWAAVTPELLGLAAWGVAAFVLGTVVLGRRVETL